MGLGRNLHKHVKQVLYYNLTYTSPDGEGQSMGVIPAGSIITAVEGVRTTVFNAGTSNQLFVGTAANRALYATAGDIALNTTGFTSYVGKNDKVDVDTEILVEYDQSGTAATTGDAWIMVEYYTP